MRIIAFDPGGTTGVATYNSNTNEWLHWTWGPQDHHHQLDLYLREFGHQFGIWIYEEFIYQRRELDRGVQLVQVSLEYIGIIKAAHEHWVCEVPEIIKLEESRLQYKKLFDDRKLQLCELWNKPSGAALSPHERDATRHLLHFLVRAEDPILRDIGKHYVGLTRPR